MRLNQNLLEHNLPCRRGKKRFWNKQHFSITQKSYRFSTAFHCYRSWKSEVGTRKSEVGSQKSEVGSRKTLLGFRSICFSRNKRKRKSGPAYEKPSFNGSLNHEPSKNFFGAIFKMVLLNREFKLHVYGKRQTSDSS